METTYSLFLPCGKKTVELIFQKSVEPRVGQNKKNQETRKLKEHTRTKTEMQTGGQEKQENPCGVVVVAGGGWCWCLCWCWWWWVVVLAGASWWWWVVAAGAGAVACGGEWCGRWCWWWWVVVVAGSWW
jgi:hypothetical protein